MKFWGSAIERIHLKFCKRLLNLKQSATDSMVYGKLGRYPMEIQIKTRMITYCLRLINGKDKKYAKLLYELGFKLQQENRGNIGWFENIKSFLNHSGLCNIWLERTTHSTKWLKANIKLRLTDQFKQNW